MDLTDGCGYSGYAISSSSGAVNPPSEWIFSSVTHTQGSGYATFDISANTSDSPRDEYVYFGILKNDGEFVCPTRFHIEQDALCDCTFNFTDMNMSISSNDSFGHTVAKYYFPNSGESCNYSVSAISVTDSEYVQVDVRTESSNKTIYVVGKVITNEQGEPTLSAGCYNYHIEMVSINNGVECGPSTGITGDVYVGCSEQESSVRNALMTKVSTSGCLTTISCADIDPTVYYKIAEINSAISLTSESACYYVTPKSQQSEYINDTYALETIANGFKHYEIYAKLNKTEICQQTSVSPRVNLYADSCKGEGREVFYSITIEIT